MRTERRPPLAEPETEHSISNLAALDLEALRAAWTARFRDPAPAFRTKDLLLRALVYKLESRRYGGPPASLSRRLGELAHTYTSDPDFQPTPTTRLEPGTRLRREWNGVVHVVDRTEAGFVCQGETYRSLSEIARVITGARWSGPRFFGLLNASESTR